MSKDREFQVLASELSRKRKTKTFLRIRPAECPLKRKYCYKSFRDQTTGLKTTEEYKCPYLVERGLGNEDGVLVIICSCVENTSKFIMEKEEDEDD